MPENNLWAGEASGQYYPVPKEWTGERIGQSVAFIYRMSLDDLIEVEHIDGMNDYLDAVLRMTDATLTDISYRVHGTDDNESLFIRAEGVLEEF